MKNAMAQVHTEKKLQNTMLKFRRFWVKKDRR